MGKEAAAALNAVGIPTVSLSAKTRKDAVRVGTMHGMKGLEFQAVVVVGVADETVPAPSALTESRGRPGRLFAGSAARTVPVVRHANPRGTT
jgi:superfamily I DNA/RNA helicase